MMCCLCPSRSYDYDHEMSSCGGAELISFSSSGTFCPTILPLFHEAGVFCRSDSWVCMAIF